VRSFALSIPRGLSRGVVISSGHANEIPPEHGRSFGPALIAARGWIAPLKMPAPGMVAGLERSKETIEAQLEMARGVLERVKKAIDASHPWWSRTMWPFRSNPHASDTGVGILEESNNKLEQQLAAVLVENAELRAAAYTCSVPDSGSSGIDLRETLTESQAKTEEFGGLRSGHVC
jgi:hypothetical protein